MKKVIINKIDGYDYELKDNNQTYIKNIEFYSNYKPVIGDIIYLDDLILDEDNLYAFDEVYDTSNIKLEDVIKVVHGTKEYYFQRRYG